MWHNQHPRQLLDLMTSQSRPFNDPPISEKEKPLRTYKQSKSNSNSSRRRIAGLLAAATVTASVALASNASPASALLAGTPPTHELTLSPATGNSGTPFNLVFDTSPTADKSCQGGGDLGYQWHSFITPLANDAAQLQFPAGVPTGPAFTGNLRDTGGLQVNSTGAAFGDGGIAIAGRTFAFSHPQFSTANPNFLLGSYKIGVACTYGGGDPGNPDPASAENIEYWSTVITLTASAGAGPNNYTWIQGLPPAVPAPPVLISVTPASGQLTAAFTAVTANPAVSGYTVSATAGASTITATGASSPIVVPGLTNGTTYSLSVVATNSQGNSAQSNVISGPTTRPVAGAQPAPTAFTAVPGAAAGSMNLTWVAPTGLVPTGYNLDVTPAGGTTSTVAIAAGATSHTLTGLTAGVMHNFVLTATYSDTSATATAATTSAATASERTLQQEIQVVRPNGALILTQRCGVNNALPLEAVDAGFPGFPEVPVFPASDNQIGTSPDIDLTTDGVQVDPEFVDGSYPFADPARYPTKCIINLGSAQLLTTGDLRGQYYAANGALNEVTIVDTRDGDAGWSVTGSIPTLNRTPAPGVLLTTPRNFFSGDLVGWSPAPAETTAGQTVTPGTAVVPGTVGGLSAPQVLASALPLQGLGVAALNARIKVLIPVAVNQGAYVGTLTLNAS